MRWFSWALLVLALLAGVAALGGLWRRGKPVVESLPTAPALPGSLEPPRPLEGPLPQGGVYDGVVVTTDDRPIAGAHVLLISYDADLEDEVRRYQENLAQTGGMPDPALIPQVGSYEVAGEKIADEQGRFRIAADGVSWISHLAAYRAGFFPEVVDALGARAGLEAGKPLRIVLQAAGRVLGQVVDDETGEAVSRAQVDVYLQQKTRPPPEIPEGAEVGTRSMGSGEAPVLSELATLGRFLSRTLGPRVWGIPYQGTEALRLTTDENGRFELGPLGPSVQVEFVVTHPDYKWTELDRPNPNQAPRRTVVLAGETVERTLRLKRGWEIAGQVLSKETGAPLKGVTIEVESISAYLRHWWYRAGKSRNAVSDAKGRFRVAGLAPGDQRVTATHPSFGSLVQSVSEGTNEVVFHVPDLGALRGTIRGFDEPPRPGGWVNVTLEPAVSMSGSTGDDQRRVPLEEGATFSLDRLVPGAWRIWIRTRGYVSQPVEVDVRPNEIAQVDFEVGGGGAFWVQIRDERGRPVEPASGRLIRLEGEGQVALGQFLSRQGEIRSENVSPGRYRLEVRAAGYTAVQSEEFEVADGREATVILPALTRPGWLQIDTILGPDGRPVGDEHGAIVLEMRQGNGPWQRFMLAGGHAPLVSAGAVSVRARAADGLSFERTYQVGSGETVRVEIRLGR